MSATFYGLLKKFPYNTIYIRAKKYLKQVQWEDYKA